MGCDDKKGKNLLAVRVWRRVLVGYCDWLLMVCTEGRYNGGSLLVVGVLVLEK